MTTGQDDQSFEGKCHTCGQEYLEARVKALERAAAQVERVLAQLGWSYCFTHDVLYIRTDENVCPACWRGE